MGIAVKIDVLKSILLTAEDILNTEYSFDRAEHAYMQCLKIIEDTPEIRPQFVNLLTSLFEANVISAEPLAFLMHALRWHEVREWAEARLRQLPNPLAAGRPLEKIIEAFDEDWENREFYELFSKKSSL